MTIELRRKRTDLCKLDPEPFIHPSLVDLGPCCTLYIPPHFFLPNRYAAVWSVLLHQSSMKYRRVRAAEGAKRFMLPELVNTNTDWTRTRPRHAYRHDNVRSKHQHLSEQSHSNTRTNTGCDTFAMIRSTNGTQFALVSPHQRDKTSVSLDRITHR